MKKLNLFLVSVLFSAATYSQTWVGYTKITNLYPTSGGYVFMVAEKHPELSSCDHGGRFLIKLEHNNYDAMVATLMMAFAADKSITINVSDELYSTPVCSPEVNRLLVKHG